MFKTPPLLHSKGCSRNQIPNPRCGYVGDVVDDILAARAAKKELEMTAIGFLGTPVNRKVMKKAFIRVGADLIIQTPEELLISLRF